MKVRYRWILLLISALLCFGGSVLAKGDLSEEIVIQIEGAGAISNGNLLGAREIAISDALRNAVEQVVGMVLDSTTRVEKFELLQDSIYLKTNGYVVRYTVLKSWIAGDIYNVQVEATVRKGMIIEDVDALQLTIVRAGDPRVLVLIPEQHISRPIPDPAAETEIIRQLLEAGFKLVDSTHAKAARESTALRRALSGDESGYRTLAAQYDADLLVVGEAFSETIGVYKGIVSCRARVEVRVIRADTGEILAAHGIHQSGADLTEATASKKALAATGQLMGKYLIEVLPRKLVDQERSIQISVSGINFTDLRNLEKNLRATQLVKNVYIRDFIGGLAQIDLDTSLLPMQLADIVADWDSPKLEVIGLSGNKIELQKP